VRAFSHLPQPAARPSWATAPELDSGHEPEAGAREAEDNRPWYLPRLTPADIHAQAGEDPAKDILDRVPQEVRRLNGVARSLSHRPEQVEDDAVNGHAAPGRHEGVEPPTPPGSGNPGPIGPVSPRGATPPTGRSLFLALRPMPPEYARQQTQTYAAAPGNRGNASNSGYASPLGSGDQLATTDGLRPQATGPGTETKAAQRDSAGAALQAPAQSAGVVQQDPGTGAVPKASGANAEGSALQEHNRIRLLDESDPGKPPKQRVEGTTSDNKPREQFEREKAAYEKAKATAVANHAANERNKRTLKAWENYDRAIQFMEKTPEGRKVLDHLRNDKTRVFKVVMVNDPIKDSYLGTRIKTGAQGQYVDTGRKDDMGREIHVLFLTKSALEWDSLKPDGTINPDAEALEKVWHELYHAYERHTSSTGGVDPLGVGTSNPKDRLTHQYQAHERRAVRFENIIRKRNSGTRMKNKYGGGYITKFGRTYETPPIDVPDAEPLP
jgi:hypothetical protein